METTERERLGSRLGFLMLAAGCAVGLGNVWRFPFVAGRNGGAAFVLAYLFFLTLLGFPMLSAELALGRASRLGITGAFRTLSPTRNRRLWTRLGFVIFAGNVLLMSYYTDVAGWLLKYSGDYLTGRGPGDFSALTGSPWTCLAFLAAAIAVSTAICSLGVRNGVERIAKWMMLALLVLLGVLAARALTLPGAAEGLAFYLKPDWARFAAHPWRALFDAMGQAFFTLSTGVGCMAIFGSYTGRERSIAGEAFWIIAIDTAVALAAGLVVFPACATYGVDVCAGPGLIFEAMPKVFSQMAAGRIWGFAFFLFLSLAALTTIVGVFECIIGGLADELKSGRVKTSIATGLAIAVLSLPATLIPGALDFEDFIFGQFWLPLGSLAICIFTTAKSGWGAAGFTAEASAGEGPKFPRILIPLMKYAIPLIIPAVVAAGILS